MPDPSSHLLPYLIPLVAILLVLRRNLRPRRLKVERLWLLPVTILLLTALSLAARPPTRPLVIAVLVVAFALGGVAGWYRGRLTRITVDPEPTT